MRGVHSSILESLNGLRNIDKTINSIVVDESVEEAAVIAKGDLLSKLSWDLKSVHSDDEFISVLGFKTGSNGEVTEIAFSCSEDNMEFINYIQDFGFNRVGKYEITKAGDGEAFYVCKDFYQIALLFKNWKKNKVLKSSTRNAVIKESSELVIEAVSTAVTQGVKTLFNKTGIKSDVQKKINNILNQIYKTCNEIGNNEFVGGRYEFIKGHFDDNDYYNPSFDPNVYMVSFDIKFNDKKLEVDAFKRLQTEMKSFKGKFYDKYENNYGDLEMVVDGDDNKYFRTAVIISADMGGLNVCVLKSVPLDESVGTEIGLPLDKENCEGTDVSGVATPTGTLNKEKKIVCPKCKSENVNVRDDDSYYCVECDYSWKPGEESVEEKKDKKRKKVSVKEGAMKDLVIDAKDMYDNVTDIFSNKNYPVESAIKKAFKEAGGTVKVTVRNDNYIEYSGKIKGRTIGGAVMSDSVKGDLNKLAEDIAYAYFVSIGGNGSFRDLLPMLKESVSESKVYEARDKKKDKEMFTVLKDEVDKAIEKWIELDKKDPWADNSKYHKIRDELEKNLKKKGFTTGQTMNIGQELGYYVDWRKNKSEKLIDKSLKHYVKQEVYESTRKSLDVSEASKYKAGVRYKTDDNMFFIVKKINRDGTIRVYDEDVEKEYNVEISDLELLHPVMVKEGVETLKECTKGKVVGNFYWGLHKGDAVYVRRVDNIKAGMFEVYDSKGNLKTTTQDKEELEECTDIKYSSLK